MDSSTPRGVLLVHGAWHTGHAWNGIARDLRDRGVPVAVAELHRGSLAADIAAAASALDSIPSPVIACGHSYGGAVITGLDPRSVAHLVYLAAVIPDVGESSLGLMADAPQSDLSAAMIGDPHGITTIDPTMAGALFHGHLTEEQRADRIKALVPQLMTAGYELTTNAAWRTRPSTYVICDEDRVLHPDLQRRLSERATYTVSWQSDHGAFASHEADTIDMLHKLAVDS